MTPIELMPEVGEAAVAERWLQEARAAGQADAYAGKREPLRHSWDAALEIHVTTRRGRVEIYHATARDMSPAGIGFQCRQAIPPFSSVKICLAGESAGLTAVVTHCTPTLTGHVIGAEFRFEQQPGSHACALKVG